MAVQREIVDKDGNRLTVVQGGAGKAAVYGKTAAGEWVPLQVDAAGRAVLNVGEVSATIGVIEQGAAGEDPWPVQLNGRSVEELTIIPAQEIRDTEARYTSVIDASKYRSIRLIASSTLDKPVQLIGRLRNTNTTRVYNESDFVDDISLAINISTAGNVDLTSRWPYLKDGVKNFAIRYQCSLAPTSGSLTIIMWGVPN